MPNETKRKKTKRIYLPLEDVPDHIYCLTILMEFDFLIFELFVIVQLHDLRNFLKLFHKQPHKHPPIGSLLPEIDLNRNYKRLLFLLLTQHCLLLMFDDIINLKQK